MSNQIFPNPEESHRLCQNIDRLLMEHLKVTNLPVSTAQYSTQVNMDEERFLLQNSIDKKKAKRKQYKQKKKQKKKQNEQSARICLSVIINEIYQGITNFEASKEKIQVSLNQLIGGQKFHMFLNDAIKLHVKNIQKDIWDFMQSIINQNSLDQNSDDQQFYLQMIDYIYSEYCKLMTSSQEIQKIINLFMCINSNSNQHQNDHYGLDRSTFIFMIQSDQTIKSLLKFCHRRVLPKHALHSERIRELTQIVNKNEKEQYTHQDIQATQLSTSVDDEDQQKTTRRKRKRKLKDSDFKSTQEQVVRRLDDMVIIKDKRSSCQVTQEWADKLKQKYIQN